MRHRPDIRTGQDRTQQAEIGLHAIDASLCQRRAEGLQRLFTVSGVGDDLADHGVVVDRHLQSRPDPAIDPDASLARPVDRGDQAGAGAAAVIRVLGVDAGLDRMTAGDRVRRQQGRNAGRAQPGQPQHLLHQVEAKYLFRNRVLHLQAGVHLQERRFLLHRVVDELDSSGRPVPHRCGQRPRRFVQPCPQVGRQAGSGCLLDHLLVAAL